MGTHANDTVPLKIVAGCVQNYQRRLTGHHALFAAYTPGETVAEARVTTPPGPPLARGGKVMPAATRFCHTHAWGNGRRGSRHHPPCPPLSKGGKSYAACSGSFQEGTVAGPCLTPPPDKATSTLHRSATTYTHPTRQIRHLRYSVSRQLAETGWSGA